MTLLVGRQEGHPACKIIGEDGGGGHWLVRMEWRPAGCSVCLPLLIFPCTIKSRSSLLAPAHPGGPGERAVKRLCVCVCKYYTIASCTQLLLFSTLCNLLSKSVICFLCSGVADNPASVACVDKPPSVSSVNELSVSPTEEVPIAVECLPSLPWVKELSPLPAEEDLTVVG